jgi:hypothetical protein
MQKTTWLQFKSELASLYEKFGYDNIRNVRIKGQRQVEEQILSRVPHKMFDSSTYGSKDIFDEFQQKKDLKLVWARMSSSVREYKLDPYDVANIAPDNCPVTGALIDYGYGRNRVTDNPFHRPGIDHIVARGNFGAAHGDISNIQILSQHFNTVKSYGTEIEAIKWVGFELSK